MFTTATGMGARVFKKTEQRLQLSCLCYRGNYVPILESRLSFPFLLTCSLEKGRERGKVD